MGRLFSSPDGLNYRQPIDRRSRSVKFQLTTLPVRLGLLLGFHTCNDEASPVSAKQTYLENKKGISYEKILTKHSSSARWAIGGHLKCRTSFALTSPDALNDTATGTGSETLVKILSHGGSHYLTVATVACELAEWKDVRCVVL